MMKLFTFFDFMKKIRKDGIKHKGKTYHFKDAFTGDMICQWKLLRKGGPCKVQNNFCHLFSCEIKHCASFFVGERFSRCKEQNHPFCYHHKVDDDNKIVLKDRNGTDRKEASLFKRPDG